MMLEYLKYSVTFDWPQRTLAEEVTFQKGFGTITGPNESGKSFMLEMIRWLLFGSKALRGEASTYKKLTGLLKFKVRGESYTVERTANSATLKKGDKPIAVGTKPVNVKIVQIFGYGLDVFDVANVVNQSELTKFGEMKPTERKQMVDNVIGLGVIDALAKMADNERLEASREAKSILDYVKEPVAPEPVDGYDGNLMSLSIKADRLRELTAKHNQLVGVLSQTMSEPVKPAEWDGPSLKTLQDQAARKQELKAEIAQLSKKVTRKPTWTLEQLDAQTKMLEAMEEYEEAQQWLRDHPRPEFSLSNIDIMCDQQDRYNMHKSWLHITETLADLRNKGIHKCPHCEKVSFISHEVIEGLERELARLPATAELEVEPVDVDLSVERAKAERFKRYAVQFEDFSNMQKPDSPTLSRGEVKFHTALLYEWEASKDDAKRLADAESELAMHKDWDARIREYHEVNNRLDHYRFQQGLYAAYLDTRDKTAAEMAEVEREIATLHDVNRLYEAVRVYLTQKAMYDKELAEWSETMAIVKEKQDASEEWTKAKLGLVDFRTKVKQHLIPSLNIAGSALLQQMTGGQRQFLQVDDDFNVTVDGQGLHTLSGSGQVVANLALRIGLGRVLTNNVFSVFIGDELDGSMDPDRAENTAQTVRNLSGKVSQILMITHKYPEADYYIKIGNANDR